MQQGVYKLSDGRLLHIRKATVEDARAVLDYVQRISAESDFLSFGPGEFLLTELEERDFILQSLASANQLYLLGLIDEAIVTAMIYSGGRRPRVRHSGEISMSVRNQYWGLGIGSLMLDTFLAWAKSNTIVKKINLRVRTDTQRAIGLYEARGFVIEGTIHRELFVDGKYFDHYWMGLEL
jgi:RimJ/RimL family protein N-acetyltransferase